MSYKLENKNVNESSNHKVIFNNVAKYSVGVAAIAVCSSLVNSEPVTHAQEALSAELASTVSVSNQNTQVNSHSLTESKTINWQSKSEITNKNELTSSKSNNSDDKSFSDNSIISSDNSTDELTKFNDDELSETSNLDSNTIVSEEKVVNQTENHLTPNNMELEDLNNVHSNETHNSESPKMMNPTSFASSMAVTDKPENELSSNTTEKVEKVDGDSSTEGNNENSKVSNKNPFNFEKMTKSEDKKIDNENKQIDKDKIVPVVMAKPNPDGSMDIVLKDKTSGVALSQAIKINFKQDKQYNFDIKKGQLPKIETQVTEEGSLIIIIKDPVTGEQIGDPIKLISKENEETQSNEHNESKNTKNVSKDSVNKQAESLVRRNVAPIRTYPSTSSKVNNSAKPLKNLAKDFKVVIEEIKVAMKEMPKELDKHDLRAFKVYFETPDKKQKPLSVPAKVVIKDKKKVQEVYALIDGKLQKLEFEQSEGEVRFEAIDADLIIFDYVSEEISSLPFSENSALEKQILGKHLKF